MTVRPAVTVRAAATARAAATVRAAGTVLAALALAGCSSLGAPAPRTSAVTSPLTQAQATHEYRSPAATVQTAGGAAPTPIEAVRAFAREYINWTAETVTARMRALAAESIGQARSAMQLAAAETAQDYELRRGGIANSGTVEAVALLAGHRDAFVVVTRELTTATATTAYQGLRPAWHIALATAAQLAPGRWVISRWQPES
ncbi:MAG TPA: hypothetical protein VMU39_27910 [Solirubrobacteraceae bacterium]|nr:hypothetical protein [Solirubrobacteraceae bacterium]